MALRHFLNSCRSLSRQNLNLSLRQVSSRRPFSLTASVASDQHVETSLDETTGIYVYYFEVYATYDQFTCTLMASSCFPISSLFAEIDFAVFLSTDKSCYANLCL